MKKVVYPPMPFCIGVYKFSKVKSVPYFVKNLENFHFGEKSFHRNDSKGKVAAHCEFVKVNFEYSDHWDKDKEIFRNACNITALNKWFRQKITTTGGKGKNNSTTEQQQLKEESSRKKDEEAQILVEEYEKLVVEEAQMRREEE